MTDLNSVTLVGRLTRDCEIKYGTTGTAICRFSVANTQNRKDGDQWKEESHFFDCVMLGKRADALQKYLTKGQQVAILGVLQQQRWHDSQTGANRSRVEILVNDIQLVGGKRDSQHQGGGDSEAVDNSFHDDIPF